jgi:hypothetical protein
MAPCFLNRAPLRRDATRIMEIVFGQLYVVTVVATALKAPVAMWKA